MIPRRSHSTGAFAIRFWRPVASCRESADFILFLASRRNFPKIGLGSSRQPGARPSRTPSHVRREPGLICRSRTGGRLICRTGERSRAAAVVSKKSGRRRDDGAQGKCAKIVLRGRSRVNSWRRGGRHSKLRHCDGSLQPLAPRIRRWGRWCYLTLRQNFPPPPWTPRKSSQSPKGTHLPDPPFRDLLVALPLAKWHVLVRVLN